METSKQIPGFRQYEVTPDGSEVRRPKGGRKTVLKQSFRAVRGKEHPNGYMYVTLMQRDFVNIYGELDDLPCFKCIAVHRLVALTYLGQPQRPGMQVNHKDGNKLNNHWENLEWVTAKENIKHSYEVLGREALKGNKHWAFGRKVSAVTKRKMSRQKTGSKHPKFKGYYMVYGVGYPSAQAAEDATGLNKRTINRRCKLQQKPDFWFNFSAKHQC